VKDNPILGNNTFGQLAAYGPERCYVMRRELELLTVELRTLNSSGSESTLFPFNKFYKALQGLHEGEDGLGYFQKAVTKFLERFRHVWEKHMAKKWRSSRLVWYSLAGEPRLAKEMARWLVDYDQRIVDDDEEDSFDFFAFGSSRDETLTLAGVHKMSHGREVIKIRDAMIYMTGEADRGKIMGEDLIKKHWSSIQALAESPEVVRLFDFIEVPDNNSNESRIEVDEMTWDGHDYTGLSRDLIRRIFIHSSHQQRCENYVQMMIFLTQTSVSEAVRSIRAIIVAAIIRRFNPWGLATVQEMRREANKLRDDNDQLNIPKRLQGKDKTYLWLKYLRRYFKSVDKAIKASYKVDTRKNDEIGTCRKNIINRLASAAKKASYAERQRALELFKVASKEEKTIHKAELAGRVEKTALIGEKVRLGILFGTKNRFLTDAAFEGLTMETIAEKEIIERKINVRESVLKALSLAEKRRLLREDEHPIRVKTETSLEVSKVRTIKPQSLEMKFLLEKGVQTAIDDFEKGIDTIERSV